MCFLIFIPPAPLKMMIDYALQWVDGQWREKGCVERKVLGFSTKKHPAHRMVGAGRSLQCNVMQHG